MALLAGSRDSRYQVYWKAFILQDCDLSGIECQFSILLGRFELLTNQSREVS